MYIYIIVPLHVLLYLFLHLFPIFEWIKSPWHPNSSNPVRAGQFQALTPFFLGWKYFWLKCFKITKHSFNFGWFKCFQIIKRHFGWLTQLLNTSGYTCCWLTPRSNMFFRRCPIAMLRWHRSLTLKPPLSTMKSDKIPLRTFIKSRELSICRWFNRKSHQQNREKSHKFHENWSPHVFKP